MSLISRGMSMLTRVLGQAAGTSVTVSRSGQTPLSLTAWVGRTVFAQQPEGFGGPAVVFGERDYLVPVSQHVFGGVQVPPQEGDQWAETIAGVACLFEVFAPGGEPCWRFSDQTRQVYRVHTKRVVS